MKVRLSQAEILEAVQLLLRKRGDMPTNVECLFKYKFGLVGEPLVTLVGDAIDTPNAGQMYLDCDFTPLPKSGSA